MMIGKKRKFAYQDSLPLVTMYQNISQSGVRPPLKKYMYGYFVSQIFVYIEVQTQCPRISK